MFSKIKQLMSPTNKDLRKRIYFTLFCLAIFSFGTNITVPWASIVYEELGFLEIYNLMSGGGLKYFSIFALGVTPYITAQIITQLLQMDIIPYFKELKEQGYTGRQKINKITRYLGIIFAFIQAYVFSYAYMGTTDALTLLKTSLVITAGTAFLLWLGDQITKYGIGNGLSLIIMAGILQSMPTTFITAFNDLVLGETFTKVIGSIMFGGFVVVYLAVIIGIIWVQLAERRIPIQYANRTHSAMSQNQNFLPIKLNSAGVVPVIFASSILTIPDTIIKFIGNEKAIEFSSKYLSFNTSTTGLILYLALIFFFGYFYTYLQMNPDEMSKNLNKSGAYIPGVRPGADTNKYISNTLGKLTIVGTIFLMIIAGLPIVFSRISGLSSAVSLGGTGLLIVVGVAIETYKQIESSLVSRSHRRGIKK